MQNFGLELFGLELEQLLKINSQIKIPFESPITQLKPTASWLEKNVLEYIANISYFVFWMSNENILLKHRLHRCK